MHSHRSVDAVLVERVSSFVPWMQPASARERLNVERSALPQTQTRRARDRSRARTACGDSRVGAAAHVRGQSSNSMSRPHGEPSLRAR